MEDGGGVVSDTAKLEAKVAELEQRMAALEGPPPASDLYIKNLASEVARGNFAALHEHNRRVRGARKKNGGGT